jgi:uncharacterized protein YjbI with pentapeptide repeats
MSGSEGGNRSEAQQRVNSEVFLTKLTKLTKLRFGARAHSLHECGFQKSNLPQANLLRAALRQSIFSSPELAIL